MLWEASTNDIDLVGQAVSVSVENITEVLCDPTKGCGLI